MSNLKFVVMGTGFWSHYQIPAWFEVGGRKQRSDHLHVRREKCRQ
jgi:hypothetical protein